VTVRCRSLRGVWHTEPVEKVEPVGDNQAIGLLSRDAFRYDLQATDAEFQNGWFYALTNATSALRAWTCSSPPVTSTGSWTRRGAGGQFLVHRY